MLGFILFRFHLWQLLLCIEILREIKLYDVYVIIFWEMIVMHLIEMNNKIRWIDYQFGVRFLFILHDKIFYLSCHTILIMRVHFEMKTLMAYSSSNVEYADN